MKNKVSSKDMKNVNLAEDASDINLEAEMEKYLGGDDDVLKGFLSDEEEVVFDSINPDTQAQST